MSAKKLSSDVSYVTKLKGKTGNRMLVKNLAAQLSINLGCSVRGEGRKGATVARKILASTRIIPGPLTVLTRRADKCLFIIAKMQDWTNAHGKQIFR